MKKMTNAIGAALAILMISSANAQPQCPDGLTYMGQAYKEASASFAEAKVAGVPVLVTFPVGVILDDSYRQSGGRWAGGDARAVMTDGDVPNGLHIIASGTQGGSKGWAVHRPQLKVLQEKDGFIAQRGYEMKLYCHTGSGDADKVGHVSCNVRADFCAKIKQPAPR